MIEVLSSLKDASNLILTIISTAGAIIAWVKARSTKKCIECNYKKRVEKEEIVSELKGMSRRKLEEMEGVLKTRYLQIASDYCDTKELLNYSPYKMFITCVDSVKTRIMAILVEDFYKNHLNKYTYKMITERADHCFKQLTDIFDSWYSPEGQPCRIELYKRTAEQNIKILEILKSIYEEARDIKKG